MAAVEMKPVNAWSVKKPRYPGYVGKYRDAEGYGLSGWFEREYKYTKHMIALNNGNVMTRYRFPKVEIPFSSPMHRWENLWFCGGWSTQGPNGEWVDSDENLLQAVIDGLKPMGFIMCSDQQEAQEYAQRGKDAGLVVTVNDNSSYNQYFPFEVAVCQHGTIGELFDIDALIDSYGLLGDGELLDWGDTVWLLQLKGHELSDYLTEWDYANPWNNFTFALTGLLLGYPVESTVAVITGAR
jgi:hypothetical protein